MKKISTDSELLLTSLKEKKIMTINEMKKLLNTNCRMKVFRKLSALDYISSYSHSGKYYSLKRTARYNKHGIWSYNSALFSKHGTLKKTIELLIESSAKGYTAFELNKILKVKVDDVLLELIKNKMIIRKKLSGIYTYFANDSKIAKNQELTRKDNIRYSDSDMKPKVLMNELKAALIIFLSTLDEKQRRLYAGYESLKIGHGGDKRIAELLDTDQRTVAKGRKELLDRDFDLNKIRKSGGGRRKTKKKFQKNL